MQLDHSFLSFGPNEMTGQAFCSPATTIEAENNKNLPVVHQAQYPRKNKIKLRNKCSSYMLLVEKYSVQITRLNK